MKLTQEEIRYINALSEVSGADAKDCIISGDTILFLIKGEKMGLAIGKNGATIKTLRKKLGKKVELFEYDEDVKAFIRKAFFNITINGIEIREAGGKKIAAVKVDSENMGRLLQNSSRIRKVKEIMKKDYNIDDLRLR